MTTSRIGRAELVEFGKEALEGGDAEAVEALGGTKYIGLVEPLMAVIDQQVNVSIDGLSGLEVVDDHIAIVSAALLSVIIQDSDFDEAEMPESVLDDLDVIAAAFVTRRVVKLLLEQLDEGFKDNFSSDLACLADEQMEGEVREFAELALVAGASVEQVKSMFEIVRGMFEGVSDYLSLEEVEDVDWEGHLDDELIGELRRTTTRIAKGEASDLDESWKEVVLPLYRLVKNYALHIFSNLKELVALWEDTYPEDVVGGTLCFEMDGTMMLVRTEGLKRYEVKLAGDLSGAEHF